MGFPRRSAVWSKSGMVATSHPAASQVGQQVLASGGSAVDAALAANAVLWVGEPTGCGLGGDLFALVWEAETRTLHGLNGSGRSPLALTLDDLRHEGFDQMPKRGPLSLSVPGCVDAWWRLHKRFSKKRASTLLRPAIQLAEEGVAVPPVIAGHWAASEPLLRLTKEARATFLPWNRAPKPGDLFRNPRLGSTLRQLVAAGPDTFYRGRLTGTMASAIRDEGGFLEAKDFACHRSDWVEPISTNYRGFDVFEIPPNGQGLAVLQILNLLEGFDLPSRPHGSAEYWHLMVEAKKIAYADRSKYYADPAFASVPVEELASKGYADRRRAEIRLDRASDNCLPGELDLRESDTVYLCAADAAGNAISLIQSNYMGFGSGVMAGDLGFMFQNRGTGFSLDPNHANRFEPGKRPFHTIIPGFVMREGAPYFVFGVMGGDMQPQGQVQVLTNLLDYGMDAQAAGDAPRLEHVGSATPEGESADGSGTLIPEPGIAVSTLEGLASLGHRIGEPKINGSGYQGIRFGPAGYEGGTESRKDGVALGV